MPGAEYVLGQKMIKEREDLARGINNPVNSNTRSAHQWVAGGVAALFGINTVTGVWNLYETRHQEEGRALRVTHAILMLASDAGFATTGLVASRARRRLPDRVITIPRTGFVRRRATSAAMSPTGSLVTPRHARRAHSARSTRGTAANVLS